MAENDACNRLIDAPCKQTSKTRTQGRHVQPHGMLSAKMRSARKAARHGSEREAVVGSKRCGLSSSSASKKSAVRGRSEQRKRVERETGSRHVKVEGDWSAKN